MRRIQLLAALACSAWMAATVPLALAGEGHDHGETPAASSGPALPRFAAASEIFELVGVVKGKDLTAVKWIVGTGGALTKLEGGETILEKIRLGAGKYLLPKPEASILMDREYRFSALGTLAQVYPEEVKATFAQWVKEETA